MNRWTLATFAAVLFAAPAFSQKLPVTVRSPDGRVAVKIGRNERRATSPTASNAMARPSSPRPGLRLRLAEGDVSSVDIREFTPRSVNEVHKLVATKAAQAVRSTSMNSPSTSRRARERCHRCTGFSAPMTTASRSAISCRPAPGSRRCRCATRKPSSRSAPTMTATVSTSGRFDSSHEGEFDPIRPADSRAQHLRPAAGVPHGQERLRHRRGQSARLRWPVSRGPR